MASRIGNLLLFLLLLAFLAPAAVMAHKVNIFAYVEGGIVYSESYFPDGRPIASGKVQVFDSTDELLLVGQTDKLGLFQFPLPKQDELTLVIDAGMGHKNNYLLKKIATNE